MISARRALSDSGKKLSSSVQRRYVTGASAGDEASSFLVALTFDPTPHAPAFVTLLGCVVAHGEDWAVITQQDGCGPLSVVFGQPHVMRGGVAAMRP
jgi:hypothetical protein